MRNSLTCSLQLLGQGNLIPQHLVHDLSTQVDLRRHLRLDPLDVADSGEQQVDALRHLIPVRILALREGLHRVEDELGLRGRLWRRRGGIRRKTCPRKEDAVNPDEEHHHTKNPESPTNPKRRS